MSGGRSGLACRPATPERWKDVEALFGERGACGGCWCMTWRVPRPVFDEQKGEGNKRAFRKIVKSGATPGILLYDGNDPVGLSHCAQLASRRRAQGARRRILSPALWPAECWC